MKLYETLEQQLKKEPNFVTDNGVLKKWVVIDRARNYDEELIELLLENEVLKEKFFVKVKDVLVFKQDFFLNFLEQKNYLNDSYTKFKNKIGLTIDGKFLKQRNEVALVWPFKDCILEGGQTKEEQKRNEILFNEILAQDEITQLLEPKVLTNAKRIDKDGEKPLDQFNRDAELNRKRGLPEDTITDNLIIKGNNLLALHTLKKEFAGKVKLIYIDPPYNTQSDNNTFKYNNNFNHSTWYSFIKNRIEIAKEFLSDNGFFAVSIDHYELFYTGLILDEIFKRENRLGIVTVVHKPEGRQHDKFFSPTNEFLLVYAKNSDLANFNKVAIESEIKEKFNLSDNKGNYLLKEYLNNDIDERTLRIYKPNNYYPIYVSQDLTDISLEKVQGYHEIYPITSKGVEKTWITVKETFEKRLKDGEIVAKKENEKVVLYYKFREQQRIKTHWIDKKYNATSNGTKILNSLIDDNIFSFPKSVYLIKDILAIMTKKDDIILDFFSGSGTTAHAVLELNKEDGGNRQFILVEQMDYIETVTCKRVQKVMEKDNLKTDFVYLELKKYNQTFIEQIEEAQDTEALLQIWEQMKAKAFFKYSIDLQKFQEGIEEFKQLDLAKQKELLCEILDKNQLYVNLSSLNDTDFACTEEEKKITKDFYRL